MQWQASPYTINLLVAALIAFLIAFFAFRRWSAPGAISFAVAMSFVGLWMLGYAIRWAGADIKTQLIGIRIVYLGISIESVSFFIFSIQYIGKSHWLTKWSLAFLFVIPVITQFFIWTNNWHGFFWKQMWMETVGTLSVLRWERGPWSRVNAIYSYFLGLFTFVFLIMAFIRAPRLYKGQAGAVLFGGALFWVIMFFNSISTSIATQDAIIKLAPISTPLFGISMLGGIIGFRLFDIAPIARSTLVDGLENGVIVLDRQKRVVDINLSAARLFGRQASQMIGKSSVLLFQDFSALLELCDRNSSARTELQFEVDGRIKEFDVRVSVLKDTQNKEIGQGIIFHEITEFKHAQDELLQQQRAVAILKERERLADELHDSIGQVLGYVNVQAQAIHALQGQNKLDDAGEQLIRLADVAKDAQVEVREYIFSAKTEMQLGRGVVSALRQYLARYSQNYSIATHMNAPDISELFSPVVEAHVLRIVQEVLNNVRKHAQAQNVNVEIRVDVDSVNITIMDDGVGFEADDVTSHESGHFGNRIMHERAVEIASTLTVESAPGRGTCVSLKVPRKPKVS